MCFYSGLADDQLRGDFCVGHAPGDETEHLLLALGQLVELSGQVVPRGRTADELLDEPAGERRREQRVPRCDGAHGVGQLGGRRGL